MTEYYFTFRSITAAMQAEGVLAARGIESMPIRSPAPLRQKGCGYSLRVIGAAPEQLRSILSRGAYQKLYRKEKGQWREVSL